MVTNLENNRKDKVVDGLALKAQKREIVFFAHSLKFAEIGSLLCRLAYSPYLENTPRVFLENTHKK